MNTLSFRMRGGTILGRDHARSHRNRQDGYALKSAELNGKLFLVGAVSDGCGSGCQSEIAGSLLPLFVVNEIRHLLSLEVPLGQIPDALYPGVLGFLEGIRKQLPFVDFKEMVDFVKNYLLATVIGFVLDGEEGVIFHAGDGFLVINNEVIKIEYEKGSPYVGYHLVPRSFLRGSSFELPRSFETVCVKTADIVRLAVATDGFTESLLSRMWSESFKGPLGIQLWLNWINGPRNSDPSSGLFYDDASVVALERIGEEESYG